MIKKALAIGLITISLALVGCNNEVIDENIPSNPQENKQLTPEEEKNTTPGDEESTEE